MRLALVCLFKAEPIRFRRATAKNLATLSRAEQLARLAELCLQNAAALRQALAWCAAHGVGGFRVNSQIWPLKTHPTAGYDLAELPGDVTAAYRACGACAQEHGLRLSLHPDQFVVLNSPSDEVTARSLAELEYQAHLAGLIGADVINLHAGGVYNDRAAALERLAERIAGLPLSVRKRLTLENDDRLYAPHDLLPLCHALHVPLCYDAHHHRCHGLAEMSIEDATQAALGTWNREPLFHISSRREERLRPGECHHADYISPSDIPACWRNLRITLEVEAKAKELAVLRLRSELQNCGWRLWPDKKD